MAAEELAGGPRTGALRSVVPGVAPAGLQGRLALPTSGVSASSGNYCRELREIRLANRPLRVERVGTFSNLVVSLFFSPRKCLVSETVVFIHRLPLPSFKKNLFPTFRVGDLYF